MSKKAKQYTPQEKTRVVMEAIKGDLTMAQVSSQYGIHASQINRWKKEAIQAIVAGFNTKPRATDTSQTELVGQLYQLSICTVMAPRVCSSCTTSFLSKNLLKNTIFFCIF